MSGSRRGALQPARAQRGSALVMAIVLLTVTVAFTGVMYALALHERTMAEHALGKVQSTSAAEGATEVASRLLLTNAANWTPITTVTTGTATIGGMAIAYTITPLGGTYTRTDLTGSATCQQFFITSIATSGPSQTTVRRVVEVANTHAFQFGVFYVGDLEFFPARPAVFAGRIHTNRDLYIGYNNSTTGVLRLDTDYVRSAGGMFRHKKDNATVYTNPLEGKVGTTSSYVNWPSSLDSQDATFATDIQALFLGNLKAGSGGVSEIAVPELPSTAIGGYYDVNAGLTIKNGVVRLGGVDETVAFTSSGALTTALFYDGREQKIVTVTDLNIGLIPAGKFPANGLIYAQRTATAAQPDGIRIKGAATLPAGMTVVSPNPVYLLGNFNTVAKKPAAVICDAFNILSNAWTGVKDPASGSAVIRDPPASDTTYNVSIVTGNTDTTPGVYNGGLENLPRMHENWTGRTLTITGSFACFWTSQIGAAQHRSGVATFQPPNRVYQYEPALATGTLPPFTPQAYRISNSTFWTD